ncbi:tail fiber assembly protein [Caballeronia sp. NK8]|uniref:tail fiber assembly protein n=1 Tax=Caballeronia sp. NK8 TaxID=140098 RepID=UPI001BB78412|nr:tail fiber assembly protein [Caballeronia sp. NK8]BCQ23170.1 tail fiber assembly protein [Caballeronia sp. NK8]
MENYALVQNGQVVNVIVWDGTPYTPATDDQPAAGWSPPEGTTAVKLDADSTVSIGYGYDGSTFTAPPAPPVPAPTMAEKQAQQSALMTQATNEIAVLTDATDPDIVDAVDPADVAELKAWKQYRVALSKIDITQASPVWPTAPSV